MTIVTHFRTIDHFRERRVFKSWKGARAYARKRIGDTYDVGSFYLVDAYGIGKLEVSITDPTPEVTKACLDAGGTLEALMKKDA